MRNSRVKRSKVTTTSRDFLQLSTRFVLLYNVMRAYWKKFPDEWGNGGTGGEWGVSVHVPPLLTSVHTLHIFCPTKCAPYDMFPFMRGRNGRFFFSSPEYVAVVAALEKERSSSLIKYSKISTAERFFFFLFFSTHFISPKIKKDHSTLTSITET